MSAAITAHEQLAALTQRRQIEHDEATEALSNHKATFSAWASQLAEFEAVYIENATLEALGLEPSHKLPGADVLEKLRASIAAAEPVSRRLTEKVARCEQAVKAAISKHRAAVADHLRTTALQPALNAFQTAFDGVRDAAVNVMAAHHLTWQTFNDRAPEANSALELYGPVAELLHALNRMDWPSFPYEVQPAWLPRYGRFWPDELPDRVPPRGVALAA